MGANSKISWTDHTYNPWWGCEKISPACKHCYAESFAHRLGHSLWGKDAPRRFASDDYWNEPRKWNRAAEAAGKRARVFCASMADVFEDRRDLDEHRARLWRLIDETPWLSWQLLTKRPENMLRMTPWGRTRWPGNIWAGITAENQEEYDRRVRHLRRVPAAVRFLSCEPLLSPIDLGDLDGIDWVITGYESGAKARPTNEDWVRGLRDQTVKALVCFFYKQKVTQGGRLKVEIPELDGRRWAEVPESAAPAPGQLGLLARAR